MAEGVLEEDLGVLEVRRDVDRVEFVPLVVLEGAEVEVPLGKGSTDGLKMGAEVETLEIAADVDGLLVVESDPSVVLGWPTTDVPLKKGFGVTLGGSGSKVDEPDGEACVESVEAVVSTDVPLLVSESKLDDADDGAAVDSAEEGVLVVESIVDATAELGASEAEVDDPEASTLEEDASVVSKGTAVSVGFFGGVSESVTKAGPVKLKPLADDVVDDMVDVEVKDKLDGGVKDEIDDEVDTAGVLELALDICVSVGVLLAAVELDTATCVSDESVVDSPAVLLVVDKVVAVLGSGNVDNVDAGASSSVVLAVVVGGAEKRPSITEGLELLLNKTSRSHFVPLRGPASTVAARKQAQVIRFLAVVRIACCCFGFGLC